MADQKVLRFIARGRPDHVDFGAGPMVAHYDLMVPKDGPGTRAFIGRRIDPTQGKEFDYVDPSTKQRTKMRHGVFVPHAESGDVLTHEIPLDTQHLSTYRREAQRGQILPADEFTASEMGLPWDAKVPGGGHYEKSAHAAWVKEQAAAKAAAPATPSPSLAIPTPKPVAEPTKGAV
jgi:hypothetical protein